jgi:capsular polysaccharide biosynthesis protein
MSVGAGLANAAAKSVEHAPNEEMQCDNIKMLQESLQNLKLIKPKGSSGLTKGPFDQKKARYVNFS